MKVDFDELNEMVEQRYVRKVVHPNGHLELFNYTEACSYEGVWNETTRQCRGLILDGAGRVVARPFSKFFNYGEPNAPELDLDGPVVVTDKMDGSLGILYQDAPGSWAVATRGSFTSSQAIWATEWFRRYADATAFDPSATYLFEILAAWNRIVVDYDWEGLVLLAIQDIRSGESLDLPIDPWTLQARTPRNDGDEYVSPPEGVEIVQGVSERELPQRQGKVQGQEKRLQAGVGQEVPREGASSSSSDLRQVEGISGSLQEHDPLYGLQEEVRAGMHGLRSRSGNEEVLDQQNKEYLHHEGGDGEVRLGVRELPSHQDESEKEGHFRIVTHFDYPTLRAALEAPPRPGQEGLVVFFPEIGERVKIKQDDYIAIHRLVFGLTVRRVWEHCAVHELHRAGLGKKTIGITLKLDLGDLEGIIEAAPNGDWMTEMAKIVPEEFLMWAEKTADRLKKEVDVWELTVMARLAKIVQPYQRQDIPKHRKEIALAIVKEDAEMKGALFQLLDGKSIRASAWRAVRPDHEVYKADDGE